MPRALSRLSAASPLIPIPIHTKHPFNPRIIGRGVVGTNPSIRTLDEPPRSPCRRRLSTMQEPFAPIFWENKCTEMMLCRHGYWPQLTDEIVDLLAGAWDQLETMDQAEKFVLHLIDSTTARCRNDIAALF